MFVNGSNIVKGTFKKLEFLIWKIKFVISSVVSIWFLNKKWCNEKVCVVNFLEKHQLQFVLQTILWLNIQVIPHTYIIVFSNPNVHNYYT